MSTVVKCLRTLCEERMLQEPRTTFSGASGFRKFSLREPTHFESNGGHLFNSFSKDFPASLNTTIKQSLNQLRHWRKALVEKITEEILVEEIYRKNPLPNLAYNQLLIYMHIWTTGGVQKYSHSNSLIIVQAEGQKIINQKCQGCWWRKVTICTKQMIGRLWWSPCVVHVRLVNERPSRPG